MGSSLKRSLQIYSKIFLNIKICAGTLVKRTWFKFCNYLHWLDWNSFAFKHSKRSMQHVRHAQHFFLFQTSEACTICLLVDHISHIFRIFFFIIFIWVFNFLEPQRFKLPTVLKIKYQRRGTFFFATLTSTQMSLQLS